MNKQTGNPNQVTECQLFKWQSGNGIDIWLTVHSTIRLHLTIQIPDKSVFPDPHCSTEDAI